MPGTAKTWPGNHSDRGSGRPGRGQPVGEKVSRLSAHIACFLGRLILLLDRALDAGQTRRRLARVRRTGGGGGPLRPAGGQIAGDEDVVRLARILATREDHPVRRGDRDGQGNHGANHPRTRGAPARPVLRHQLPLVRQRRPGGGIVRAGRTGDPEASEARP